MDPLQVCGLILAFAVCIGNKGPFNIMLLIHKWDCLTFTNHWADKTDDKLKIFFLTRKKGLTFHANCLLGNEMPNLVMPVFWRKNIGKIFSIVV